jgi:hypothetical protein
MDMRHNKTFDRTFGRRRNPTLGTLHMRLARSNI